MPFKSNHVHRWSHIEIKDLRNTQGADNSVLSVFNVSLVQPEFMIKNRNQFLVIDILDMLIKELLI